MGGMTGKIERLLSTVALQLPQAAALEERCHAQSEEGGLPVSGGAIQ